MATLPNGTVLATGGQEWVQQCNRLLTGWWTKETMTSCEVRRILHSAFNPGPLFRSSEMVMQGGIDLAQYDIYAG